MSVLLIAYPLVAMLLGGTAFAETDKNYTYLALGDSISYGLNPTLLGNSGITDDSFTGYPEIVAATLRLLQSNKEVNASCPGETSGSFLNVTVLDNGCNSPHYQPDFPPFKSTNLLHTSYSGSQVAFAVAQLKSNKHIELVTLNLGGNDLLLVLQRCGGAANPNFQSCVLLELFGLPNVPPPHNPPSVLESYGANLTAILTAIRANYSGRLILMKNYSPSADPLFTQAVGALNQVMTQVGANFGAKFADGFTAFQIASAHSKGDPCAAGLLIRLSPTTCDVHPSRLGQDILAATVLLATVSNR